MSGGNGDMSGGTGNKAGQAGKIWLPAVLKAGESA